MYSILFSILLASIYVSAIPMPLGTILDPPPLGPEEKANKIVFDDAVKEANKQIDHMQKVLRNPEDWRINRAFGHAANYGKISEVVNALKTGTIRVESMNTIIADGIMKRPVNAFTVPGINPVVHLGSVFYTNKALQAGTIIHEATHALAKTGDNVDTTNKKIIQHGESAPDGAEVKERGGYEGSPSPNADNLSSSYRKMKESVSNTYQNADSYRVFAALCTPSLGKRGLGKGDQRSKCNLPPDYFEKKAAAARGTTTTAKKGTTSTAAANGKTSTTKSTSIRGAKGANTVRKGKSARKATGAKAGKGLKAGKGTKVIKDLSTTKGPTTAKGLKTAKPGKGLKAVKGAKAIKGVRAAKGAKRSKAAGAGKGVKVAKEVKAAKGPQRTKGMSVKAVKATELPNSTTARKSASGAKTVTGAATKATGHAAMKAAAPKAVVKVSAPIPNKRKNLRRDVGIILDELE